MFNQQQPSFLVVTAAMTNTASSHNTSGSKSDKFQEDVATLSEMFPDCDVSMLRNYLEMFCDDPNYKSMIINMLLEADTSLGLNQWENSIQEQCGNSRSQVCLKQNVDIDGGSAHASDDEVSSPRKILRTDIKNDSTDNSSSSVGFVEIDKLESKQVMSGNNTSEACSSMSFSSTARKETSQRVFKSDFNTSKKTASSNPDTQLSGGTVPLSVEDNGIVFVKSVASPTKRSFYHMGNPDSGKNSDRKQGGICIRHKGGVLHPSMNKPKKLQIIEIDGGTNDAISHQATAKKVNSSSCASIDKKGLNYPKMSSSTVAATSVAVDAEDDDLPQFFTSAGWVSKKKRTENNTDISETNQVREVPSSNPSGLPVAAALDDLEILKKVFPEADPDYISSLLDKYADQPNRVALVGKELGSNPDPLSIKKKLVPSVPWFWQSEEGKLIPFTDSECNVLEKEFSSHGGLHSDATFSTIRLPGAAKRYNVNFAAMTMTCGMGQRTMIVRAPGGSDGNKQMG